ncbi:hypothetical protein HEP73_04188 [Xanthomonas sp. GW]|uniref:hypothetical protein n=1 Tax=Xanthomonas sp. GW TaxID=2724121 RepID=UPI00163AAEB2|nr:hypothetical protein [Xanthomonas sp. GW]QNH23235.1 hypothetical protein HEP73_04188 [Xanthomonas sp. GW]
MRAVIAAVFLSMLALCGCARSVAPEQLGETCERRLGARTGLTSTQAGRFCTCFLQASLKKVPAETLAREFETGSSEMFKSTLRGEFEQCKSALAR